MWRLPILFLVLGAAALAGCDSSESDEVDLPPGVFEVTIVDENKATRTVQGTTFFEALTLDPLLPVFRVTLLVSENETIRIAWVSNQPASGSYPAHPSASSDGWVGLGYSVRVVPDSLFPPYTINYDPVGDNAGFVEVYTSETDHFTGVFDAALRDQSDRFAETILVRGGFHAVPD